MNKKKTILLIVIILACYNHINAGETQDTILPSGTTVVLLNGDTVRNILPVRNLHYSRENDAIVIYQIIHDLDGQLHSKKIINTYVFKNETPYELKPSMYIGDAIIEKALIRPGEKIETSISLHEKITGTIWKFFPWHEKEVTYMQVEFKAGTNTFIITGREEEETEMSFLPVFILFFNGVLIMWLFPMLVKEKRFLSIKPNVSIILNLSFHIVAAILFVILYGKPEFLINATIGGVIIVATFNRGYERLYWEVYYEERIVTKTVGLLKNSFDRNKNKERILREEKRHIYLRSIYLCSVSSDVLSKEKEEKIVSFYPEEYSEKHFFRNKGKMPIGSFETLRVTFLKPAKKATIVVTFPQQPNKKKEYTDTEKGWTLFEEEIGGYLEKMPLGNKEENPMDNYEYWLKNAPVPAK